MTVRRVELHRGLQRTPLPRPQALDAECLERLDATIGDADGSRLALALHPRAFDERGEQPRPERAADMWTPLGPIETSPRQRPLTASRQVDVDATARQPCRRGGTELIVTRSGLQQDVVALESGGQLDADPAGEMVVTGSREAERFVVRLARDAARRSN